MFPLPRPTRKNRPDPKYFIANNWNNIFVCNKVWDKNAKKRSVLSTNMNEYCIHKIIKFLKRNKIQCSNGNVSIVCTIYLAKTHNVYFGIQLNCYFNTLCSGLVSSKKIFLPTYLPTHTKLTWVAGGETKNILSLA